jgi:predicted RNase H-like HicB family nuclease
VRAQYIDRAMLQAKYDQLEDGTFGGRIPPCVGVIAFAATLRACEEELRSTLDEWLLFGQKMGHALPVIDGRASP